MLYIHTHTHTSPTHTLSLTHTPSSTHTHTHTHIYIYIYRYTHTHTHMNTHTHEHPIPPHPHRQLYHRNTGRHSNLQPLKPKGSTQPVSHTRMAPSSSTLQNAGVFTDSSREIHWYNRHKSHHRIQLVHRLTISVCSSCAWCSSSSMTISRCPSLEAHSRALQLSCNTHTHTKHPSCLGKSLHFPPVQIFNTIANILL